MSFGGGERIDGGGAEMSMIVRDSSGQPIVAATYANHDLLVRAVFAMKSSEGGGLMQFGDRPQEDGCSLAGFAIELPTAAGCRVLVFRGRGGGYTLVDDFVAMASGVEEELAGVQLRGGLLVYTGYNSQDLLVRPLAG